MYICKLCGFEAPEDFIGLSLLQEHVEEHRRNEDLTNERASQ